MPKRDNFFQLAVTLILSIFLIASLSTAKENQLIRKVSPKPVYTELPDYLNTTEIVIKLQEGIGQPEFNGTNFVKTGSEWKILNDLVTSADKSVSLQSHFSLEKEKLDELRATAIKRSGVELADLTLYHRLNLDPNSSSSEKLAKLDSINALSIVEIAYFPPVPELATLGGTTTPLAPDVTPNYEAGQYYLQPAPTGIDAYYAWNYAGGKGENIKVIDIEGNWIQSHEDLHGGVDDFHIAGSRINDAGWWNHGTAVLGEIAADSNEFGMTGIAFNCDLGTVSIGSMSTANAILTATNNSDTGDVILIELHAPGPAASGSGQDGYVAMEYWQENFDVILQASAAGRIIVEAAGNGAEDFDDFSIYGSLFDPAFRFSGAIMVGASSSSHVPASFTNYGQRVDVHGFGTWDVYTLGYGDLFGSDTSTYYTSSFAGTSSASPIITGACAVLEGINKATHGYVLDHNEIRDYLTTFSTPQAPSSKHIGPLPDLAGAVDQMVGVAFVADTTFGHVPLNVNFTGSSGLSVDTWSWDFGDGNSSTIQSPSHTYTTNGLYTVGVEIDAGGELRTISKTNLIVAVADTVRADSIETAPGESIVVTLSLNNTAPARTIELPIEYSGALSLSYDSISTAGCRTDYFEIQDFINLDLFNKRMSYRLVSSSNGTSPDLAPGTGPVLKIYFTVSASGTIGQNTTISTDGYQSYIAKLESTYGNYNLDILSGDVAIAGCCTGIRGNIDGDILDEINIADIVYFVAYSFSSPAGPEPPCFEEADVDASGELNIADIVYMVDYSFGSPSGPAPVSCF